MFAAKIYHIPDLNDLLKSSVPCDVSSDCSMCVCGWNVRVVSDTHSRIKSSDFDSFLNKKNVFYKFRLIHIWVLVMTFKYM